MQRHTIPDPAALDRQYAQLRLRLSQVGYLSQGSVQDRTQRIGGGAGYQWSRKVARKTITVSLTQAQFEQLRQAVENNRQVRQLLRRMEKLSRKIIFQRSPHINRRKQLSARVLGTN